MTTYYRVIVHFRRSGFNKFVPVSTEDDAKQIVDFCNEMRSEFCNASYESVSIPDIVHSQRAIADIEDLLNRSW